MSHHLSRNTRGSLRIGISVTADPREVGRRIVIGAGTSDPAVARVVRDKIIEFAVKAGLTSKVRVIGEDEEW